MLNRTPLKHGFLNTKVNSITGFDYNQDSDNRGPEFTYGWIQGRGLEALVTFAQYYRDSNPTLSARLDASAQTLYKLLAELYERNNHAFFVYNESLQPIRKTEIGTQLQNPAGNLFTYSDAFVAKGLLAASCHFDLDSKENHLAYLLSVVEAIDHNRFQMDEAQQLTAANAIAEANDFGPRMILLGAAGVLHRSGLSSHTAFADRFIMDTLDQYYNASTGLLLNVPEQDTCNVGHGIEFCGFAFEHLLHVRPDDPCIKQLVSILVSSLEVGLQGPGIALYLSAKTGKAISPYYPWWPMPEAIRACALGWQLTNDDRLLRLWKHADEVFFKNYWQAENGYAYQTRTIVGPVDFVPATPDLDPGYHTGLSLLSAIKALSDKSV